MVHNREVSSTINNGWRYIVCAHYHCNVVSLVPINSPTTSTFPKQFPTKKEMEPQTPKFVILTFLLFFLSPIINAPVVVAAAPSKHVDEFCSRKEIAHKKAFCHKVFESDPRSASATDDLTLFKIAMEQGITKLTEIEKTFAPVVNTMSVGPKTGIQSCTDIFKEVVNTFNIYYRNIVESRNKDIDSMSMSYDFDIAGLDAFNCHKTLLAAGIHDDSLVQKSNDVMDYLAICYGITKIVAKVVD